MGTAVPNSSQLSQFLREYCVSGVSVGVATVCTNPIDVVKVRLQLQELQAGRRLPGGLPPSGMWRTGVDIVRQEGVHVLWSGWQASLARSFFYGGARLGLYEPVKRLIGADTQPSFLKNVVAGSTSGGLAAVICNPTELVKVRLQSKENRQRGPVVVIREVVREHGVRGLWRGTTPAATRAAILTASQLASYSEVKATTKQLTGWDDGLALHISCSMVAGLVSTTATSPVDVVKSIMFTSGNKFTGPVHCFTDLVQREGVRGLFKGWLPNWCRLGPQTSITIVVVEQLRKLTNLDALS